MHEADLERGMLKQRPMLCTTCSNWYQVRAQFDKVKFPLIQSARDNIAELYNLHRFESDTEHLDFFDSLLAHDNFLSPVAEHVDGGVCGPNAMQRVSKAATKRPVSTSPPGQSNPRVYLHQILSLREKPWYVY